MLAGQGVLHVHQNIGKSFSVDTLKGYYNDLTEKVTREPELLDSEKMPLLLTEKNEYVEFPVAIFQYGLGAYDLFIQTNDQRYLEKFQQCLVWAVEHQELSGAWNNFFYIYPDNPYGAMAQGEATSLLMRGYKQFGKLEYLKAAKNAISFMLTDVEKGGTTNYSNGDVMFLECTHLPAVMNGWIFAWWGLYDYVLITRDKNAKYILDKSLKSFIQILPRFTCSYWSMYSLNGMIASPFYHNLHIAQMQAMHQLTGKDVFKKYAFKWEKCQKNRIDISRAFVKKVWQKVIE